MKQFGVRRIRRGGVRGCTQFGTYRIICVERLLNAMKERGLNNECQFGTISCYCTDGSPGYQTLAPGLGAPSFPRRKCLILAVSVLTYSPAVPYGPPPSPYCLWCSSHQGLLTYILPFCVLFLFYALVLCLLPCFWCSSLSLSVLYYNSVWTDRTGGRQAA